MFQLRALLSIASRSQPSAARYASYLLAKDVQPARRINGLGGYRFSGSSKLTPEERAKLQEESKQQGQEFMKKHLENVVELEKM
jgi:hypothetical protein